VRAVTEPRGSLWTVKRVLLLIAALGLVAVVVVLVFGARSEKTPESERGDGTAAPWKETAQVGPRGARVAHGEWSVAVRAGGSGELSMQATDAGAPSVASLDRLPDGVEATAGGVQLELSDGSLGVRGAVLTRRLSAPLAPGATASLAYFDADRSAWLPVPTRVSKDRRTLSAIAHHFSAWEAVEYGAGWLLDKRVSPPECQGDLPAWMQSDGITFLDDKNAPLRWCAGADPGDPSLLQVKVAVNRTYGVSVRPAAVPEAISGPVGDTLGDLLDGEVARVLHWSDTQIPVMGGQELAMTFSESGLRASGDRALVHVELDLRDAAASVVFATLSDLGDNGAAGLVGRYLAAYAAIEECEGSVLGPFSRGDWQAGFAAASQCLGTHGGTVSKLTARGLIAAFPRVDRAKLRSIATKAGRALGWVALASGGYKAATWLTDRKLEDAAFDLHAFPKPLPRTFVNYGDGTLRYRPPALVAGGSGVACGVWSARNLHWSSWTVDTADATGTLVYNPGDPNCAEAELKTAPATFHFFAPRRNCKIYRDPEFVRERRMVFTRVDIEAAPLDAGTWETAPQDGFQCR
jgi:hypothetical protein